MPTCAVLLLLATLLPLGSFVLLSLMGKRLGTPLAGWVATTLAGLSFVCSLGAMIAWLQSGQMFGTDWGPDQLPIQFHFQWLPVGPGFEQVHRGFLDVGIYIDSLTIALFNTFTLAILLIHLFAVSNQLSIGRFCEFFSWMGFLGFSVLALVLGSTLLQIFIFWEMAGVASFWLLRLGGDSPEGSPVNLRPLVLDGLGSAILLIAIGILFYHGQNLSLGELPRLASDVTMPSQALVIVGISLGIAAMFRCAMFPFHMSLIDANDDSLLAAALRCSVFSATGLYLLARLFFLLLGPPRLFIAIVGLVTLTIFSLASVAQRDAKKFLACITCGQLGYLLLALGIGSWIGAMYHAVVLCLSLPLLFLAGEVVIRAAAGRRNLFQLGGMFAQVPLTAVFLAIGILCLAGVPPLTGFSSKKLILSDAAAFAYSAFVSGRSSWYWLMFILPLAMAYVTSFALMRFWMLIFAGRPRGSVDAEPLQESPGQWAPLIGFAGMCIMGAIVDPKIVISQSIQETQHQAQLAPQPQIAPPWYIWPSDTDPTADVDDAVHDLQDHGAALAKRWGTWSFAGGMGLALVLYLRISIPAALARMFPLRVVYPWLLNRLYIEHLYDKYLIPFVTMLAGICLIFERNVIGRLTQPRR